MYQKNKRKYTSPTKKTKGYPKKTYNKNRTKSRSKEANTESSSPISKTEIKDKNIIEIFDFKDITEKLGNSKIFCRDDEKKEIMDFIKLKEKNSKTLFVSGQPGTGKTSLIVEILNNDLYENKEYFLKFSINCLSINSTDDFYDAVFKYLNDPKIYNYFSETFDEKKYDNLISILQEKPTQNSFQKILNILGKTPFIILLDEIDFLYKKKDDYLFFSLLTIPYLTNSGVKMILISNNADFDNEIFPKLKNRNITIKKIIFKPYTHKQLANIMTLKLESIGLLKFFSNDAIKFLSTKMNKSGDIRPIDMFEIIKKKNINLSEILSSMTTEQKIVVAAIYYVIKNSGIKLEEKIIFEKYKNIKHYTNTPMLNTEEFRDILRNFIDVGLIESMDNNRKGRKKAGNMYKIKYSDDDLSLIFQDPLIFSLFNSNQEEEDKKVDIEKHK